MRTIRETFPSELAVTTNNEGDGRTLSLVVPPATRESRMAVLELATKRGEGTALAIKEARGRMQKTLHRMRMGKTALPDEITRAGREMERKVEDAHTTVKEMVRLARARLLEKQV